MGRLCDLLWDGDPPAQAAQTVRSYAARIRALLDQAGQPRSLLLFDGGGYRLAVPPDDVDAHRFRRLVDLALATDDRYERDRLLRQALALWRGPALHHTATDRLRQRLCVDLEELRLRAGEESLGVNVDLGRHQETLPKLVGDHAPSALGYLDAPGVDQSPDVRSCQRRSADGEGRVSA